MLKSVGKIRVVNLLQKSLLNPLVKLTFGLVSIAASGAMSSSLLTIRIDPDRQRATGNSMLACPK